MDKEGAQVYDLKDGKAILRLGVPRSEAGRPTANVEPGSGSQSSERQPAPISFPEPSGYLAVSPDGTRLLVTTAIDPKLSAALLNGINQLTRRLPGGIPTLPVDSSIHSIITLWSLETGRQLAEFAKAPGATKLARFSTDGRAIVVYAEDGVTVFRFDSTGNPIAEVVAPPTSRADHAIANAKDVLMPTPDRLYVGTERGVLSTWDRIGGVWRKRFEHQNTGVITRLAVSPSGRTLAAVIYDAAKQGSVLVLDAESGAVKARLDDNVSDLCFLGERSLATSSVRVWNLDEISDQARH